MAKLITKQSCGTAAASLRSLQPSANCGVRHRMLRINLCVICLLISACHSETEWNGKEVGNSGIFISFPQEVTFQESFLPLGGSEESFYSKLSGNVDENTSYSIAILQLADTSEEEIIELIQEQYFSNQNCNEDIPPGLDIEMSLISKEIITVAGKQSFLIMCAINTNGVDGVGEIYLLAHKNHLLTLSVSYSLNSPSIQSKKFLASLELKK